RVAQIVRVAHAQAGITERLEVSRDMIGNGQNDPELIALIAAARALYARPRWVHRLRVSVGVGLAILAVVAVVFTPALETPLAVVGAGSLLVSWMAEIYEERLTVDGAKAQEEFDTRLFGLRWNHLLVGDRVPTEVLRNADRRFRGDRGRLADW